MTHVMEEIGQQKQIGCLMFLFVNGLGCLVKMA